MDPERDSVDECLDLHGQNLEGTAHPGVQRSQDSSSTLQQQQERRSAPSTPDPSSPVLLHNVANVASQSERLQSGRYEELNPALIEEQLGLLRIGGVVGSRAGGGQGGEGVGDSDVQPGQSLGPLPNPNVNPVHAQGEHARPVEARVAEIAHVVHDLLAEPARPSSHFPQFPSKDWWIWTSASHVALQHAGYCRAWETFPDSPFVPINERQWLEQRLWYLQSKIEKLRLAIRVLEAKHPRVPFPVIMRGGQVRPTDCRAMSMLERTVWSRDHVSVWTSMPGSEVANLEGAMTLTCKNCGSLVADWPGPKERSDEGDHRRWAKHRNNFQRMLPLPRLAYWSQNAAGSSMEQSDASLCRRLHSRPLDSVNGLAARMGHVEYESELTDESEMVRLLGPGLMPSILQ